MLPATLEWHALAMIVAASGLLWLPALFIALGMLGLSVLIAILQSSQATISAEHRGLSSRAVVAALCYIQPLVRSWKRYQTRFFHPGVVVPDAELPAEPAEPLPLRGERTVDYWSEQWHDRSQLLSAVVAYLTERRWAKAIDPGWSDWDVVVYCHPWTEVAACTVQEDHGGGRRLIRARFRLRLRNWARLVGAAALLAAAGVAAWLSPAAGGGIAACLLALGAGVWCRGARRAARAVAVFDRAAGKLGLIRCEPKKERARPEER
jgi:hypothetical protein